MEVMNRTIEQYLRSFVHHQLAEWYKFLALAEWSYNTLQHFGTEITHYKVIYGKPPPSVPSYLLGSSHNDVAATVLRTRAEIHADLKRRLTKAQDTMKCFADKQRREVQYEVRKLVYVKLRPHRHLSIPTDKPNKLTKRYFGPFCILERIAKVAYRLQLPSGSRIHPVFHCSMLRPHHGPFELPTSFLPPEALHNQPLLEPLAILGS